MAVIDLEHSHVAPLAQIEQREMPPDVGDHERVQTHPGVLHSLEELRALVDLPAGKHHVRERMLRPRLLAAQAECGERRPLRLIQQVTLFVGKRRHAMHVGVVRVALQHLQRDTQHLG